MDKPRDMYSSPGAIIFDWDNTLVDSWQTIHETINATLGALGLEQWSIEETLKRVRKSLRDSFPGIFGERWKEAEKIFYERYSAIHLDALKPLPGAFKMLEELHHLGIYLAVVSNKNGKHLRQEVEHLGWGSFFGNIVGATDAKHDKPAAEPVEMALAGVNIGGKDRVWFAGDTEIDMECAVNSGSIPVLVRKKLPTDGEFSLFPPALHFSECQALSNFVTKL